MTLATETYSMTSTRVARYAAAGAMALLLAACNNDADDTHHARVDTTLDPGTYFVQVDGHASGNEGSFTLEYRTVK